MILLIILAALGVYFTGVPVAHRIAWVREQRAEFRGKIRECGKPVYTEMTGEIPSRYCFSKTRRLRVADGRGNWGTKPGEGGYHPYSRKQLKGCGECRDLAEMSPGAIAALWPLVVAVRLIMNPALDATGASFRLVGRGYGRFVHPDLQLPNYGVIEAIEKEVQSDATV